MLIAIDSSTAWAGVCLYDTKTSQVVDERIWRTGTRHCEQLIPVVDESLRHHGLTSRDLTGVAVAVGPGTFNGVRVAVATAKLLARARDIPLVGFDTLELYAAALPDTGRLVRPLLSAARGEIATALWRAGPAPERIEADRIAAPADLFVVPEDPTLFVGELTDEWRAALAGLGPKAIVATPGQSTRRPSVLAELGAARIARGDADDTASLAAVYLRPPHITRPRS